VDGGVDGGGDGGSEGGGRLGGGEGGGDDGGGSNGGGGAMPMHNTRLVSWHGRLRQAPLSQLQVPRQLSAMGELTLTSHVHAPWSLKPWQPAPVMFPVSVDTPPATFSVVTKSTHVWVPGSTSALLAAFHAP